MYDTVATANPMLTEDARCIGCGYCLRGLTSFVCPECGRRFNPRVPASFEGEAYRRERRQRRLAAWLPGALWAGTTFALFVGSARLVWEWRRELLGRSLVICLWAIAAGCGWFVRCKVRSRVLAVEIPVKRDLIRFGVASAICCGLLNFHYWSCPHATGFVVGPVGLAHSDCGGPCHNWGSPADSWHLLGSWYFCCGGD